MKYTHEIIFLLPSEEIQILGIFPSVVVVKCLSIFFHCGSCRPPLAREVVPHYHNSTLLAWICLVQDSV